MSMLKIIPPGSQSFNEPVAQLIKVAQRGFFGGDKRTFLKRASADFLRVIETDPPKDGEEPLHVLALGTTEAYGPNRNGDGFRVPTCRRDHHTFKQGRWFRNHKNQNKAISFGIIKESVFNDEMQRIELLVYLNGNEKAAKQNGGLVADVEMEKLASGQDIATSMSTKVPYDVCSGCGNQARTRSEYCTESTCIKYGGLQENLSRTFDDGHTLHADNPVNDWFDISNVIKQADRIAYALGSLRDTLTKAASTKAPVGGAELAEIIGLQTPTWLLHKYGIDNSKFNQQLVALEKLAAAEKRLRQTDAITGQANPIDLAFIDATCDISGVPHLGHKSVKLAQLLTALADTKCLLPPAVFMSVLTQDSQYTKIAASTIADKLYGIHSAMLQLPDIDEKLHTNPYVDRVTPTSTMQEWAKKRAADWSLDWPAIQRRIYKTTIRNRQPRLSAKTAAVAQSNPLAQEYALYQVGLMSRLVNLPNSDVLADLIVRGNKNWSL